MSKAEIYCELMRKPGHCAKLGVEIRRQLGGRENVILFPDGSSVARESASNNWRVVPPGSDAGRCESASSALTNLSTVERVKLFGGVIDDFNVYFPDGSYGQIVGERFGQVHVQHCDNEAER